MRALTLVVPAALGLLACKSTSSPVADDVDYPRTVSPEMVTGAALRALRPDGRFSLETPAIGSGQVSLSVAQAQAQQFLLYSARHGPHYTGDFTDYGALTLCGDAYYMHTQLAAIPTDIASVDATTSFLRRFGPRWLVSLCDSAKMPRAIVDVAIDGNDIRFENSAPVEPYRGPILTAWSASGIPLDWPDALTISAERAARFAFETFGVRVAEVPQLFFRGQIFPGDVYQWTRNSPRSCHRWRVVLESDVSIKGMTTLSIVTTHVVHVGALTCDSNDVTPYIHLPRAEQPSSIVVTFLEDLPDPPIYWLVDVPVSAPILFEFGTRAPQF